MRVNENIINAMRRHVGGALLATVVAMCASCATTQMKEKSETIQPNFTGVWKVRKTADFPYTEVYSIVQNGADIQVVISIADGASPRILDFTGKIDGQPHRTTILGLPAQLICSWQDDKLIVHTIRGENGETNFKRVLTMYADGKTIAEERTMFVPGGWERPSKNIWDKQ